MAAVFHGSGEQSSCLAFHRLGQYCVNGARDGTVRLIDAVNGCVKKVVYCKKYGIGEACFGHHEQSILCSGGAQANDAATIRYLSLYDNRYVRAFDGHDAAVTTLEQNPADDTFLSCGADGRVVLWDLGRPDAAVASLKLGKQWSERRTSPSARAAFSSDGIVFAVGASHDKGGGGLVKVYDARKFNGGPFATFAVDANYVAALAADEGHDAGQGDRFCRGKWTAMEFSPDGNRLLVATDAGVHLVLDSFEGDGVRLLDAAAPGASAGAHGKKEPLRTSATFTSDGYSVVAGCDDAKIRIWDVDAKRARPVALHGHAGPVRHVACSRKFDVLASACANTVLWLAD